MQLWGLLVVNQLVGVTMVTISIPDSWLLWTQKHPLSMQTRPDT
jgi:hypothetical protein